MNPLKTFARIYLFTLLALIGLAVLVFHPMTSSWPQLSKLTAINLQQLVILLSLGGLPGVLVWSSRRVKALKKETEGADRLARYTRIVYTRLAVFATVAVLVLALQAFTHMKATLMMFMVVLVLFLFIWPTSARFDNEMNPDQPASDADASDADASDADATDAETDAETDSETGEDETDDGWLPK